MTRNPNPIVRPYVPPEREWFKFLIRILSWMAKRPVISTVGFGCALMFCILGSFFMWLVYDDFRQGERTATPTTDMIGSPTDNPAGADANLSLTPPTPIPAVVTYNFNRAYAFPIAAEPAYFTWTHYHWDGGNALDIEARLGLTQSEFDQVTRAQVVAATSGTVRYFAGVEGGQGYILQGVDGLDYYYAHLDELFVDDYSQVAVGQPLGRIGSTGANGRFVERHLQFSIGTRDTLWSLDPNLNAADWILERFGLHWTERTIVGVPAAHPTGWPVDHPRFVVETHYDPLGYEAQGLPEPSIEFGFIEPRPATPVNVYATLTGTVNLMRWTPAYGSRIQITNTTDPNLRYTVIISGVDAWYVTDGQSVTENQVIGQWNPNNRAKLHYMIFENDVNINPELFLD